MGCSLNIINKFSFLGTICAECDLTSCVCDTDSQITETEDTYSMGYNYDNQMTNTQSALFSETVFMAMSEQQDPFYNNVVASMRPSSDGIDNRSLTTSINLSNDTCVNHPSVTGTDSSLNMHFC